VTGRTVDGSGGPDNPPHGGTGAEDCGDADRGRGPGRRCGSAGRMVLITAYLHPHQYEAIMRLVDTTGAPMAYYVREAIDAALAVHGGGQDGEDEEEARGEGEGASAAQG